MQRLLKEMGAAGVRSLELQAKVCAPKADLLQFLAASRYPPYDAQSGLLIFSQVGKSNSTFRTTLFLQGCDEAKPQRIVLEIVPGVPEKIDAPFERIGDLVRFFRQPKAGYRFSQVRGVVHLVSSAVKGEPKFPWAFSDNMNLVGIRLEVRKNCPVTTLIENVIFERVGDGIHRRIATRELDVKDTPLSGLLRLILKCRTDLRALAGAKQ